MEENRMNEQNTPAQNYTQQNSTNQNSTGQNGTYQNGTYQNSAYQGGNQYYQSSTQQYQTPNNHKKAPKQKKERKALKLVASALVFGLIAGVAFQGVNLAADHFLKKDETVIEQQITGTTEAESDAAPVVSKSTESNVVSVAQNCMPSIVSITNMSVSEVQSWFGVQSQEKTSAGSGIIVGQNDTELLIATNNHVIANAETLTVTFADDSSVEAKLKGTDEQNDVAVIAVKLDDIESSTKEVIKIAELGDSDSLCVGETAIAIGNALGYGQSVTAGIISATNRTFNETNFSGTFIQTDAAINPGNSGGALLNASGQVIGINVAKEASSEVDSMGYAIPISVAKPILDELMNRETREIVDESERGALGIYGADVDSTTAQMYNMPTGVYVSDLVEDGAAQRAGIQKSDVITKLDGQTVGSMDSLKNMLQYYKTGETVTVTLERAENGEYTEMEIQVILQSGSSLNNESENSTSETDPSNESGSGSNGFSGNGGYDNGNGYSGGQGSGEDNSGLGDIFDYFFNNR